MQQIGSDGGLYRLSAVFTIRNDQLITRLDGTGDAASVRAIVPTGRNVVTLLDGYTLSRSTDNGATFTPVDAVLGSTNPVVVNALPGTNTVKFEFLVRTPTTYLAVTFGVETRISEISGTLFVSEATGFYEDYLRKAIPFRMYYTTSKQAVGLDLEANAVFCVYSSSRFAIEYTLDDEIGFLNLVGPQLAGHTLRYETRATPPDGPVVFQSQSLAMTLEGPGNTITFDRTAHSLQPKDSDGCPADPGQVGLETSLPFFQTSQFGEVPSTLRGTANLTFIPPM